MTIATPRVIEKCQRVRTVQRVRFMKPKPESTSESQASLIDRAICFAREHPGVSIVAATGVGLFGGIEVAAGVLFGAVVAALVARGDHEAPHDHVRSMRERARAAVGAARGRIAAVVRGERAQRPAG
jgi:hypothetical protein